MRELGHIFSIVFVVTVILMLPVLIIPWYNVYENWVQAKALNNIEPCGD